MMWFLACWFAAGWVLLLLLLLLRCAVLLLLVGCCHFAGAGWLLLGLESMVLA